MYFSQCGEDKFLEETFFSNKRDGTYIEMGALDGKLYSNSKYFEDQLGWKGILIEPHPEKFKDLEINRPNNHLFNELVSDANEPLLYRYCVDKHSAISGVKSTLPESHFDKWMNDENLPQKEIKIQPTTLTKIVKSTDIKHIDFLSLDVEGHEFEVLKSYDFSIPIDVILMESLEENKQLEECIEFLKQKGYKLKYKIAHNIVFVLSNSAYDFEYPNISILTPTWNRPQFLSLAVFNVQMYNYDKNKLEWVILDDHPTRPFIPDKSTHDQIQQAIHPVKLNYIRDTKKHMTIGEKRNRLVKEAKYQTICFQDDDDIYMPSYLKHSYDTMRQNKAGLVGSPEMLFVFPKQNFQMSYINCPTKRMSHEATFMTTKKYIKSMGGFPKSSQGEGAKLIDFSEKRCARTDIRKIMICVCHDNNTCAKQRFLKDKINGKINPVYYRILGDIFGISQSDPPES
jgi:FkbM family methyltransferase